VKQLQKKANVKQNVIIVGLFVGVLLIAIVPFSAIQLGIIQDKTIAVVNNSYFTTGDLVTLLSLLAACIAIGTYIGTRKKVRKLGKQT
jgi:hypothetical protein